MLFSEPKIPQSDATYPRDEPTRPFQCSSASRKFLNSASSAPRRERGSVSVLFSEPKIPQFVSFVNVLVDIWKFQCSSASRKFLNPVDDRFCWSGFSFQCSSASRKFLNVAVGCRLAGRYRFSALQRAENSSIVHNGIIGWLNSRFSALQRAENSSIIPPLAAWLRLDVVSVLFSEPKIPQCAPQATRRPA